MITFYSEKQVLGLASKINNFVVLGIQLRGWEAQGPEFDLQLKKKRKEKFNTAHKVFSFESMFIALLSKF